MEEVGKHTKTLKNILQNLNDENYLQAEQQFCEILKWLWKSVVGPVLDSLGYKGSRKVDAVLPRIWWVA